MKLSEFKGVFKQPVKKYYLGRISYGTPYMYPRKFISSILKIRKEKPKYNRNTNFDLFGYNISIGYPIWITWHGLGWKDKYNSPRFEWLPAFYIFFFNWQFVIHWAAPYGDDDDYYEQILFYLYYSNKDIVKAKENWGWVDAETQESTWNDDYLI